MKTPVPACRMAGNLAVALVLIANYLAAGAEGTADKAMVPPMGVTGTVRQHDRFASQFVDARNVHVWLPPWYENQSERRFPQRYQLADAEVRGRRTFGKSVAQTCARAPGIPLGEA